MDAVILPGSRLGETRGMLWHGLFDVPPAKVMDVDESSGRVSTNALVSLFHTVKFIRSYQSIA